MAFNPLPRRNVALGPALKISPWRKIALGSWPAVGDPSIYGLMEFDAVPLLNRIEELRAGSGERVTLTHMVGKAVAETIRLHPEINCLSRLGRLYPRKTVDVFFMVAADGHGEDLSGAVVRSCDTKNVVDIARDLNGLSKRVKTEKDPVFRGFKLIARSIPGFMARPLMWAAEHILYVMNVWTPLLGVPRDPFGSVMITNIGSLGLEFGFAALVPYSRTPMVISIGAVREAPWVRNGKVEVTKVLKLGITIDHRTVDGIQASFMSKTLRRLLETPAAL